MSVSLCGNSYGCLTLHDEDGTMGTELSPFDKGTYTCGQCQTMAVALISFLVGEEIEFVMFCDEWVLKSHIQARLEDMLLFQLLKPEIDKFNRVVRGT
jgi:hypothetical protein